MNEEVEIRAKVVGKHTGTGWFGRTKYYMTFETTDHRIRTSRLTKSVGGKRYHNFEVGDNVVLYGHIEDGKVWI